MDEDEALARTETQENTPPRLDGKVGPYRLLKELGRGGMGVVYLAARADDQYQKRVALKVIKAGLDRIEVIRRFRRERQILASLEHPNIARFLDGGTTHDGLPYFVMEHVEGLRIDDYCDRRRLSSLERLKLFRSACSAIEYAHRNLIVHRDVKPGNVLITSEGVPKLLDFGIARLTNPGLGGQEATATVMVMTPEYASPEQARGETVTTASDVYSLGVVLYELLTGHLPYRLKTRNTLDVLRAVCDEEPEKPSTAVGRTEVPAGNRLRTAEEVSRLREESSERLKRRLRGDLDTILLTALRKEPSRRYSSVEAFGEDIRRYLEGLPIKARKSTVGYRTRKFVARHWAAVAGTTVAALLVMGFSASTYVQSVRAQKERDKAERVSAFLLDLFKVSDPSESRGNTVTAREILDEGAEKIRSELKNDADVRATLMDTMGNVYRSLGLYGRAEELLREAFEARRTALGEHPDVARAMHDLANLLYSKGDLAGAEILYRDSLAMRRKLLGKEHPEVAKSIHNLANVLADKGEYAGAEALYRESLAMKRKLLGDQDPSVAATLASLATVLEEEGDYPGAQSLNREALELQRRLLGSDHPDLANNMNNLALALSATGDYAAAEATFREALGLQRRLLGNEHPDIANTMSNLAIVLRDRGDPAGAEGLFEEALAMRRKFLGAEHPEIAQTMDYLAVALSDKGDYAAAEALFREALAMDRRLLGQDHWRVAEQLTNFGALLVSKGRAREADSLLREALAILGRALPKDHPHTAAAESVLGACLAEQGRFSEAEPLLVGAYARITAKRTGRSREARDALARIVKLYEAWGRPDKVREYSDSRNAAGT